MDARDLGSCQQDSKFLAFVRKPQFAALLCHAYVDMENLAQASRVYARHTRHIQNAVEFTRVNKSSNLFPEQRVTLANPHLALEEQRGDTAIGSFFDLHGATPASR